MTELPPLALLVRTRHDRGDSYREMAERARRAGHTISHSQLQAYATDIVRKAPDPMQLKAIAAACDLRFEVVRAASIEQFYGYVPREVSADHDSVVLAAVPSDLSQEEEAELARLVSAWVATRKVPHQGR